MTDDWILSVLADIASFADMNGMTDLSAEMNVAAAIAAREIGVRARTAGMGEGDTSGCLRLDRRATAGSAA